jgi:hypothetical protein
MQIQPTAAPGFYSLLDNNGSEVDLYVSSSAAGQALLCDSIPVGHAFQDALATAVADALKSLLATDDLVKQELTSQSPDVLYILRGGLNFGLHSRLEQLVGRPCRVSFVSSARTVIDGQVLITDDAYRKIEIEEATSVVIADIAATGTTFLHALSLLADDPRFGTVRRVVAILIATQQAVSNITAGVNELRRTGKLGSDCRITIVSLEGIFSVYQGSQDLEYHLDRTDFIRKDAVLAPEFMQASIVQRVPLLERCVIYDGGTRGFFGLAHLQSLGDYWSRTCELFALDETALARHLFSKNDLAQYQTDFKEWRRRSTTWAKIDDDALMPLYRAGRSLGEGSLEPLLAQCMAHRDAINSTF